MQTRRRPRGRAEQREAVLADAAAALTSALPADEVLRQVPHLLVPGFAEWASVYTRADGAEFARIAVATSNEAMRPLAEERVLALDPNASAGVAAVMRTGRGEFYATIPEAVYDAVQDPSVERLARAGQFRSSIVTPLVVGGEVIGAMSVASSTPGYFDDQDVRFLERFAHLAGLSVQRAQMLSELRLRDERLRVALEAAPMLVFTQNRDLRYTWIQTIAPGFTVEALIGHTDEEFFPPADAARIVAAKRRAMESRQRTREQMRVLFGGEVRDFDLTVEPSVNEEGEVTGVTCAAYDVTDLRRAEETLHESEQRLRLATASAALGVFEWDLVAGEAVWENARMFEIFGRSPADGPVDTDRFLEHVHPADRSALGQAMTSAVAAGDTLNTLFRVRRFDDADGLRWVELTGRFEFDDEGKPGRLIGVVADVTERQHVAEELARAVAIKDEFLGLVSHELRTPMMLITGYARNLSRTLEKVDPESRDTASALVAEAERLGTIIENMLVLARLDQEQPDMELLDPRPIARQCIHVHQSRFPHRAVELELGGGVLLADGREAWVEQVLLNLLSNAEKYSPAEGPIRVVIGEDGPWIRIAVLDSGPGLSDEEAAHAFDPFYRAPGARGKPGLGLGLTVCRRLVTLQDGDIWAARRPEGGTEFVFRLHRAKPRGV